MKILRISLAALLCWFATFAHASTVTTDFSDLWFNPNESGWGANVAQQADTLFVTLFVYGTDGQPTWYSASSVTFVASSGGALNFSGPLYRTTGPYFGGPFNPSNVGIQQVGTLTFSATGISTANISYNVGGVNVFKSVVRNTFKAENLAGVFLGSSIGTYTACGSANGLVEALSQLTITHDTSNNTIQLREDGISPSYTCTYDGVYSQAGRMGTISGNGRCSDGVTSTFSGTELQVSIQSISMRFTTTQIGGNCVFSGRIGGMRRGS